MRNRWRALSLLCFALFGSSRVASAGVPKPAPGVEATLVVDGVQAGNVDDFVAPNTSSEVVVERQGADYFQHKHLGMLEVSDVEFTIGSDVGAPVLAFITSSLQASFLRKNGSLAAGGTQYEFFNALVTEIGFPALDLSSTTPARISVALAPEYIRVTRPNKPKPPRDGVALGGLSSSRFKVSLADLDTSGVVRVDRFFVKHKISENPIGEARDYEKEPGSTDISNLALYVKPENAASFFAWHEDFVVRGNCADADEKNGTIEYRAIDGGPGFDVQLSGVGISAIRDYVLDDVRVVRIDLYVERIALTRPSGKEGAAAPGSKASKRKPAKAIRKTVGARRPIPGKPSSGKLIR